MRLHTYTNEIIDIAKANNVSWDIGADMFMANVRNAGKADLPHYKGADNINYVELKDKLYDLEMSKPFFVIDYKKHNTEIIALRKEGKFDEVQKLMEAER